MIDILIRDPQSIPALDTIADEVRAGLPCSRERLAEARLNEDYYQLRNAQYVPRREGESDEDYAARPKRTSKLTRCVIRKLTEPLYSPGPTRNWEADAEVDTWLQDVYEDAHLNARLQSADRAATLNHVAAIQVEATGDPERPIKTWLWKAHEIEVFCRDNDPCQPWAVVTIEQVPAGLGKCRTRYRVWSALERQTYLSEPHGPRDMSPRRADQLVADESGPSPYPGVLPFVFIRNEAPESDFWEGGIGSALRECNAELDREISDIAEHVREFLNPFPWARNLAPEQRFFAQVGRFNQLAASASLKLGDQGGQPEVGYAQAMLGVEQGWLNCKTYADQTLEELDVPLTIVRQDATTDLSGVAIVAKQMPLIERTRARQPQFSETETELAATLLAVDGLYHGNAAHIAAAADPQLMVLWPEPRIPIPTPERNEADSWELEKGLADPLEVLARRRGLTLEQAEELARQIAERTATWNTLMGDVIAPPANPNAPQDQPPNAQPNPTADVQSTG